MEQKVQCAEAVPRPANHCRPSRTGQAGGTCRETAAQVRPHLEKQWTTSNSAPSTRLGWGVTCSSAESHHELRVLLMGKQALTHGLESWQFSPWGRNTPPEAHRLLQSHFLGKKAQQIYQSEAAGIQGRVLCSQIISAWQFSHNHLLHLFFCPSCAEQKVTGFLSSRFTTSQSLWGAETSWSFIWKCLLPVPRSPQHIHPCSAPDSKTGIQKSDTVSYTCFR